MRIRRASVLIPFVPALVAAGVVIGGPTSAVRAAQEPGGTPCALLQVAAPTARGSSPTPEDRRDMATQAVLIQSRSVVAEALRNPAVSRLPSIKDRTDAVARIRRSLHVTNPKDSEILQVSMAPDSGLSVAEQVVVINAVVRSYMERAVVGEHIRRNERIDRLGKIRDQYVEVLGKKRHHLRDLDEAAGRGEPLAGLGADARPRLYHDLRSRQVRYAMERAEVNALLERRTRAEAAKTEAGRKEIVQLEDRLAVVVARQKVVEVELERLREETHGAAMRDLDRKVLQDEIDQLDEAARKVGAELQALTIELEAPPRIRVIDEAAAPGS